VKAEEVAEPPKVDVRAEMVRAQDPPKPAATPVVFTWSHTTIVAPPGSRPGRLKALAQDLQRVFRDHSCRQGKYEVTFDREHVSPADRGKAG
jgi:hypothetical protein